MGELRYGGEMNGCEEGLEEDARLLRAVNDEDLVVFHGFHSPLSVERWPFYQDKAIFYLLLNESSLPKSPDAKGEPPMVILGCLMAKRSRLSLASPTKEDGGSVRPIQSANSV